MKPDMKVQSYKPTPSRLRQEDCQIEASKGCTVGTCLRNIPGLETQPAVKITAAFTEDQDWVPSTHTVAHNHLQLYFQGR